MAKSAYWWVLIPVVVLGVLVIPAFWDGGSFLTTLGDTIGDLMTKLFDALDSDGKLSAVTVTLPTLAGLMLVGGLLGYFLMGKR